MKNIIFLDIDGVLNCQLFYESKQFKDYKEANKVLRKAVKKNEIDWLEYYKSKLCLERITWLNTLCADTNADIVISSTWRVAIPIDQLQQIMDHCGATFKIIDKTPYTSYERGTEISKWLKENIKPETYGVNYYDFYNYVIIDDNHDMLLTQAHHFFQTDEYSGLTPTICDKIRIFFTHKYFKA